MGERVRRVCADLESGSQFLLGAEWNGKAKPGRRGFFIAVDGRGLVKQREGLAPAFVPMRAEVAFYEAAESRVPGGGAALVERDRCVCEAIPERVLNVSAGHPVREDDAQRRGIVRGEIGVREGVDVPQLRGAWARPPAVADESGSSNAARPVRAHLRQRVAERNRIGIPVVPIHDHDGFFQARKDFRFLAQHDVAPHDKGFAQGLRNGVELIQPGSPYIGPRARLEGLA